MRFQFAKEIGRTVVTFSDEAKNAKDFFQKAQFYIELPEKCQSCSGLDLVPSVRTTTKGDYYEVACGSCGYRKQYGQHKEGGGLFPKDWVEAYKPDALDTPKADRTSGF